MKKPPSPLSLDEISRRALLIAGATTMQSEDAALYLGVSLDTLYSLDIPSSKPGKRRYYRREDLDAWMMRERTARQADDRQVDAVLAGVERRRTDRQQGIGPGTEKRRGRPPGSRNKRHIQEAAQ